MSSADPPALTTAPAAPRLSWAQRLARGYVSRELPGWGRLYAALGGNSDARWRDAGIVTMRGKLHGYRMPLDLSNWSERLTWFLGRYHDLPLQLAMQSFVHRGSTFVDVGANLGMLSLLACHLTGPEGLVLAAEPNPSLGSRIEELAADNDIRHLRVIRTAFGSAAASAELHEFDRHSGWGSLVSTAPEGSAETASVTVPVARGDDLLAEHLDERPHQPLVIKIDVEGYEVPALRGLHRTIEARAPLMFVEAVDANQRRAGFSLADLSAELEGHGYRGHYLWYRRAGLVRKKLTLVPFGKSGHGATDAMFVPADGPFVAQVASLL